MLFVTDKKNESLLYSYFHAFHSELMQIKQQIHATDWAQTMTTAGMLPESLPFRTPLIALLEKQTLDAVQRGGERGGQLYRELKYLMVALADEFFLHLLPWDGQKLWHQHLLEPQLFNSQAAGQKVFDHIDTLLKQRDPTTLELARLYLIVLALGFQGRYRDNDKNVQLFRYRQQLYFFITQHDPAQINPHLSYDPQLKLCPQAYQYTHTETPKQQRLGLPDISGWYLALLFLFALLTLISIPMWYDLSHPLTQQTNQIISPRTAAAVEPKTDDSTVPIVELEPPLAKLEQARLLAEQQAQAAEQRLQNLEQQLLTLQQRPELPQTHVWEDVTFAEGATKPRNIPTVHLNQLVQFLLEYPHTQVLVKGFTDNIGSRPINHRVSKQRAESIRTLLMEYGIAAERISTSGLGATQPVADNATAEGRRRNRRVEITVF